MIRAFPVARMSSTNTSAPPAYASPDCKEAWRILAVPRYGPPIFCNSYPNAWRSICGVSCSFQGGSRAPRKVSMSANALRGQRSSVVAHTMAQKDGILFLNGGSGDEWAETSHIQPDGLFDWLVQNNWKPLSMVSFSKEMQEMPCAVDVGHLQWGCRSSSTTCVAQDEEQSDIPVKQCAV